MIYKKICNKGLGVLLLLLILFEDFLASINPVFKIVDELIPIALFALLGGKTFKGNLKDTSKLNIFRFILISGALLTVFLLGICGNLIFVYQKKVAILTDIITVFKGFATYLLATFVFSEDILENNKRVLNILLRAVTISTVVVLALNYIYPLYPTYDERLGIVSQQLFFTAPTYLATFGVCLVVLLSRFLETYRGNLYYIGLASLLIGATLRSKGLMFIVVYAVLFIFIMIKNKRVTTKLIISIAIIGTLVGGYQINRYVSNPDWARPALMINSFKVANDHLPLGSGFATFATWESGKNYSPLYEKYGLNQIWGLQPDDYSFVGDTYWPAIIGQFGYIGLLLVLFVIWQIYKGISKEKNKYRYFQHICILVYLLILSTSETSFMSPVGPLLCLLLVI